MRACRLPLVYSIRVKCGCGAEFTRLVTPDDADEDLLRSALLAFENWQHQPPTRLVIVRVGCTHRPPY
jgi:hypothetical protein